ncbi:MAG TPA: tripartite tricarboxylate transporter substrate-binding protein, partial [Usitatibacter sp.]|nr:tripartite tricarboxylate transporter substrate-binding protein [Usitatibacter sp.]
MQGKLSKVLFASALLVVHCLAASVARAEWPERPIRLVVPFGAGSSSDTIARIVTQKLGERLGQAFVIENKPGAATILGTEMS